MMWDVVVNESTMELWRKERESGGRMSYENMFFFLCSSLAKVHSYHLLLLLGGSGAK